MIQHIISGGMGVLLLVGFSYLMIKLQDHAEKQSKHKQHKKFEFIDKYYNQLEKASEKQDEKKYN